MSNINECFRHHGTTFAQWRQNGKIPSNLSCQALRPLLRVLCDCSTHCRGHMCVCIRVKRGRVTPEIQKLLATEYGCVGGTKCIQGVGYHAGSCCLPSCCSQDINISRVTIKKRTTNPNKI